MHSFAIVFVISFFTNSACSAEPTTEPLNTTTTSNATELEFLTGKHESLASCTILILESHEYQLLPNGSVYLFAFDNRTTLNESLYILRDGELHFCSSHMNPDDAPDEPQSQMSYVMMILTMVTMALSTIGLLLHLVAFCMVPDLRNLPGWNLAALCLSLLVTYLLIAIRIGQETSEESWHACIAMACMTHFFLLASILWMTIMSYDVFVSLLRATGSFRSSKTHFDRKKFAVYCSCVYGASLAFAVSALLADRLDFVPKDFRPDFQDMCWFSTKYSLIVFIAGPICLLAFVNFVLFGLSAYVIHSNKMKQNEDDQKSVLKRRYLMYFRLSVIMGATWVVGIVANVIREDWLWCLFIVLNTLQGFFIFLAFTCSNKVKKFFRQKILSARRSSQQTLTTPTFQSYCFYANSIEKDMDKIVENGNGKTDTIIIHI